MDRINELSDELLIKILSYLPTKTAVSTSILSKQWEYLWIWCPKLEFGSRFNSDIQWRRLRRFLDRNLPLHKASFLDSFHLVLSGASIDHVDINLWIDIAISHHVRTMEILYDKFLLNTEMFPSNLFTCKSLVSLKLDGGIILYVPRMVSLPSLKTLQLRKIGYFNRESLNRLLSNCPVLEDFSVELRDDDSLGKLTVVVPSLKSLSLYIPCRYDIDGIAIETPSLKYMKLIDRKTRKHYFFIKYMPNLIEVYLDVALPHNINRLIGSITSVKRLTICSEEIYDEGFVFDQLEHLKLCIAKEHSPDLLFRLLKDSFSLQVLELFSMEEHICTEQLKWNQPSSVPGCMLSSLRIVNWLGYTGEPGERDLAVYILENAIRLETFTIKYLESKVAESDQMIKELTLTCKASTTCKLMFDCLH